MTHLLHQIRKVHNCSRTHIDICFRQLKSGAAYLRIGSSLVGPHAPFSYLHILRLCLAPLVRCAPSRYLRVRDPLAYPYKAYGTRSLSRALLIVSSFYALTACDEALGSRGTSMSLTRISHSLSLIHRQMQDVFSVVPVLGHISPSSPCPVVCDEVLLASRCTSMSLIFPSHSRIRRQMQDVLSVLPAVVISTIVVFPVVHWLLSGPRFTFLVVHWQPATPFQALSHLLPLTPSALTI